MNKSITIDCVKKKVDWVKLSAVMNYQNKIGHLRYFAIASIFAVCHGYNLTILHTNDVHARIQEMNAFGGKCSPDHSCFGGAARMKTKIEELRSEHRNTLLLDAGDQFQGTLWFTHYGGRVTYTMMNLLGYDAMVYIYIHIFIQFST
jgi:2',3'-cyclic-nucleotide 2'-phosphodiesterase (5'-nucleotidase family)